jgi:glycosyltransferase involved in cell wall biosynthesis
MKKVLLISFFSTSRPGGSFRPAPLAKYLPEFNWEPVILTPSLSAKLDTGLRIIETPYRDALGFWKKLFGIQSGQDARSQIKNRLNVKNARSKTDSILNLVEELTGYPDFFRGWKPFAVKRGEKLLSEEKIDALISCAPMISHIITQKFRARYKIPWIADFPDLWSQNHDYRYGNIRKWFDTRLELNTLSLTDALVTVSKPWVDKLKKMHPDKKVYMIPHGYDPEALNMPASLITPKFTITYTGLIYHKWQNITLLFGAIQALISENIINPQDIEVRFYGNPDELLEKQIREFKLSGIATQYGKVPQPEAIKKQRESQLLLLLGWNDPNEKGVYTSKVFEYVGARRPILVTGGGKDVVSELMEQTKAGTCAYTRDEIKDTLKQLYLEYKTRGYVSYHGINSEIERYSHREMAKKFAKILDELTSYRTKD